LTIDGRKRAIIENVQPEIEEGRFPAKRVAGEKLTVTADIFCDGHDSISAEVIYHKDGERNTHLVPMKLLVNDLWEASFPVPETGTYHFTVRAWVDHWKTWQADFRKKQDAGLDVTNEIMMGARLVKQAAARADGADSKTLEKLASNLEDKKGAPEDAATIALGIELSSLMEKNTDKGLAAMYGRELSVYVEDEKALFSTWYELFPRSFSERKGDAFQGVEKLLPRLKKMGFDVVYLPPIHPIGRTARKGKNNSLTPGPDDPGSPWAIGAEEGGHKSIHPELGTMEDFERLVKKAGEMGMDVALDLAYQCSRDHPYIKEHPEWFTWRPDGSIQFAENPPKKYEDVVSFNFETDNWKELWDELRSIVFFWRERGVRIFRVDNPHTKPFEFWDWMISDVKARYPDTIFLAEAFTRPKITKRLAKLGFTQSYTYFTWRNTKHELYEYMDELTSGHMKDYFRPNFWPNTPDILHEYLQLGGRPAHVVRLVLAATLSSNYGIYGPPYELYETEPFPGKEEYNNNEKYQLREWDLDRADGLREIITSVNRIRKENPALQRTNNLTLFHTDSDYIMAYGKVSDDGENTIMVAVNLDPFNTQLAMVQVPLEELGIDPEKPYMVLDLITNDQYMWEGEWNYVELDPQVLPAHIFKVVSSQRTEQDFDGYINKP